MNAPASIPMREVERAQSALWSLDPSCPYDEWVQIGMAAKAAGLAEGDWRDWSAQSEKFPGDAEIRTKWASFRDGDVNAGTLFFKARGAGWQDPTADAGAGERGRGGARRADPGKIWNRAAPAPADHPYIAAKGGSADGLRVVNWPLPGWASFRGQSLRGWLVVPSRGEDGTLVAVQLVSPAGDKLNPFGCSMRDGTLTIGTIEADRPAYVVEGLGHAWTANSITGCAAVVTFGSSGLERGAREVLRQGGRPVVVADRGTEAGAEAAARAVGCTWVPMPDDLPDGQDVNDVHRARGADAALEVLRGEREAANENVAHARVPLDQPIPWGRPFPETAQSGAPLNTIENLAHLLKAYGIEVAYNEVAKEVEITIPGREFAVDNAAGDAIAEIRSLCARNRVPKGDLEEFVQTLAGRNRRNPAQEMIHRAPWDGRDRIRDLALTLDPVDPDLAEILLRRWLIGAAAAALEERGVALQGVLVLQGPQNAGKTTWCRVLAGDDDELFAEGVMLDPSDRDSVKGAISHWICELGELDATFRKADIAALKSFVTKRRDELRLPYARAASKLPRRTAFCATVNDRRFLRDETGNRRYWTIEIGPGMTARHAIEVQQVWAQAAQMWRDGEPHNLQRDELERLNAVNEGHQEISPVEELIASRFDWTAPGRPDPMTATDVLIAVGYDRPNRAQVREASTALRKLTGGEPRRRADGRVFDMPPRAGAASGAVDRSEPAF